MLAALDGRVQTGAELSAPGAVAAHAVALTVDSITDRRCSGVAYAHQTAAHTDWPIAETSGLSPPENRAADCRLGPVGPGPKAELIAHRNRSRADGSALVDAEVRTSFAALLLVLKSISADRASGLFCNGWRSGCVTAARSEWFDSERAALT